MRPALPEITFRVDGRPAPQGSKKAWPYTGKDGKQRAMLQESSVKGLKPWRKAVTSAAAQAVGEWQDEHLPHEPLPVIPFGEHVPVGLSITFRFERPKSHFGSGRNADRVKPGAPRRPTTRSTGDLSKLVRAAEDAMTDAGVWVDDSQVVSLHASVEYALPNVGRPGALVLVWEVLT